MSSQLVVDVYVDYLCPYAYAGSTWMRDVRAQSEGGVQINWKFFPLEQVNSQNGPDWKVWEQPESHRTRGWEGFRAAVAAMEQGEDLFERFHFAWFTALHDTPVGTKRPTVFETAERVGLDIEAFARDFANPELWQRVGDDYEAGRANHGVFGTPTIIFPDGASAYLQMRPKAPEDQTLAVWDDFVRTVTERPYIREIKRPVKPESA